MSLVIMFNSRSRPRKSSLQVTRREARLKRYIRYTALVVVIGLVIGGYIYLSGDKDNPTQSDSTGKLEVEQGSMEDILQNGNVTQLINKSDELDQEQNNNFAVQINSFKNQIKIADRLLEFAEDSRAVEYATRSRLIVYSKWQQFISRQGEYDVDVRENLTKLADENIDHENPRIQVAAKTAMAMMALDDYLVDSGKSKWSDVFSRFKEVVSVAKNDVVAANALLRSAIGVERAGRARDAEQMFDSMAQYFSDSDSDAVKHIGHLSRRYYLAAKYDLVAIQQDIQQSFPRPIEDLKTTVSNMLSDNQLTVEAIEQTTILIDLLNRQLRTVDALELINVAMPILDKSIPGEELKTPISEFKNMSGRLQQTGKTFDFSAVTDSKGAELKMTTASPAKLVLFWSPDNEQSVERLQNIHSQRKFFQSKSVEVATVLLDNGSERHRFEFASRRIDMPEFLFGKLETQSEDGRRFLEKFPIDRLPTLLLLNRQHEISIVDPAPVHIKRQIEKLSAEKKTAE